MKRILVLLTMLLVSSVSLAVPVFFADPNLKAAVEAKLGITGPDATQMLLLTSLDANHLGISDLTGIQTATNLTILRLSNNHLGNIDLLAGLTKMKYLYMDGNPSINSLLALADMNDLRYLKAFNCSISNINVLSNFEKLEGLSLNDNLVSNITPIRGINTLRYVYLASNNIADINALRDPNLFSLLELDLEDNFITEVNSLSGLTKLTFLNLRYNELGNINPLSGMTKLVYLYMSFNDSITDINAVENMKKLAELGLTDDQLSDISLLADVNQTKIFWLGSNQITDIFSLTKDHKLVTLALDNNPLSFTSRCDYLRQQIAANNPTAYITPLPSGDVNIVSTNLVDLQVFGAWWLSGGTGEECDLSNGYCHCADLNQTGGTNAANSPDVDFQDFVIFADLWMKSI